MDENLIIWPFWQKLLLRFLLLFFSMFILIYAIGQEFSQWYSQPFQNTAVWVGRRFFEMPIVNFDGKGSGDTAGDYLLLLVISSSALVGTAIWSFIDQRRKNYDQLFYWLVVILRCFLIAIMTVYGFAKLFKTQFPYPSPERLNETYGQSSPMALAWTFFGYSRTYNYFMGIAEVSCIPLLFFRRTTLLGSLLAFAVTANIMAINYCFDVPVKILSTTLVVMSMVVIARDAKRLFSFFFFNRIILPDNNTPLFFKNKWKNKALMLTKYLLLAVLIIGNIFVSLSITSQQSKNQPDMLLGYYNVTDLNVNQQMPLPDATIKLKWDGVTISADVIYVKLYNQEQLTFPYKKDVEDHKLVLFKDINAKPFCELSYQYIEPSVLLLQGYLDQKKINLRLELNDWEKSQLIRRSFHWVNEYPYDR